LLEKFGGHELAAGLTVKEENIGAFRKMINEYASSALGTNDPEITLDIDCELCPSEINLNQASELELLEPCGTENPTPTFACFGLSVEEIIPLSQGKHSKLILECDGKRMTALMFGTSPDDIERYNFNKVDIAFRLNVNEYMGTRSEQILIRDIRLSADEKEKDLKSFSEYEAALRGENLSCDIIPIRADFISAYLHLKRTVASEGSRVGIKSLLQALNSISKDSREMGYTKLRLVLDILNESGVVAIIPEDLSQKGREIFHITIPKVENKVDLEKSCLYKQLMNPKKTNTTE
jgi:single-stranded-DNA-specific exonuclease